MHIIMEVSAEGKILHNSQEQIFQGEDLRHKDVIS